MALKVTTIIFPGFTANCYLVTDDITKDSFLVDPGAYGTRQSEYIKSQGIEKLKYILLTHGHFDHVTGVKQFRDEFSAKVVIHENDEACLRDSLKSLGIAHGIRATGIEADITVKDGDKLAFADKEIQVIHTPGHTKGGVCYKIDDLLFTGDTLFKGTVGRTDFPGGSMEEIIASVNKLSALEGDYKIYPGHEAETTLNHERENNPYMRRK